MAEPPKAPARTDAPSSTDTAFATFYRANVKHLVGFLVLQGTRPVDAVDIAQDTMCRAYVRWGSLQSPRAWAFTVAAREMGRRRFAVEEPTAEPPEPSPLWRGGSEDRLRVDLADAITQLPERQRQVMAWTMYEYKPAEIARILSIDAGAVRASLRKARRMLAKAGFR